MTTLIIIVFVIGYLAIALEHPIRVDKSASALLIGGICWALLALSSTDMHHIETELAHQLEGISGILFFLLGAMTIVELIDAHDGFSMITKKITTTKKTTLLWILGFITFFLSAVLDNLTTAIVMSTLLTKLMKDKEDTWIFAGIVILAANAGGAWSPIGDVTTIMLWIGKQITAEKIMSSLLLPSLISLVVPLLYFTFRLKGNVEKPQRAESLEYYTDPTNSFEKNLIFYMGIGGLLFVPIFKTITHLPPYIGMIISLGILWLTTEIVHGSKNKEHKLPLSVIGVLKKVDVPTIFFFLGILLAVGALEAAGQLTLLANGLDTIFKGNVYSINTIIGILSSVIDNVPLVAGAQGMYPIGLDNFATDGHFWTLLAYCAGTGGSILIIGSAAGVATMGILKIDFIWYMKRISLVALLGYFAGIATYYFMQSI